MKKKLRKSLWGLQWIFLKNEKSIRRSVAHKISNVGSFDDSVASEIEEFPEISMRKLEDYNLANININKASNKEKYRLAHIEDLPNLSYKNPHISLESIDDNWDAFEMIKNERRLESAKVPRPKTVEIRRVVFPQKFIIRNKKPEVNTNANRRKSYGKWFIPPEKWKKSLDHFIQEN